MVIIERLYRWDTRLLLWCGRTRHYPHVLRLVRTVSLSGDGYLQVSLPLFLWLFEPEFGVAVAWHCLAALTIERLLYLVLKPSLKRRRPPEVVPSFSSVIQAADKFSFPSGHSMAAFCLASVLFLHYGAMASAIFLWAAAVASSRVLLGVHFPSDVFAGALLGELVAVATY